MGQILHRWEESARCVIYSAEEYFDKQEWCNPNQGLPFSVTMPDRQPQMLEVEGVEQRQKRLRMYSDFPQCSSPSSLVGRRHS